MSSPYERALDLGGLDPALQTYFSEIPFGSVGAGTGVFDVVGTPRRWLWPLLTMLRADGILAPVWRQDVPFTVRNVPQNDGSLVAERRFELAPGLSERGTFTMVDRMTTADGALTDILGRSGRLRATFRGRVSQGALTLESTAVAVRLGKVWLQLPGPVAPRVELTESRDADGARQQVAVSLELPVIGRIYEYSGSFVYRIEGE